MARVTQESIDRHNAQRRQYRKEHPEKHRQYYQQNRERYKTYQRSTEEQRKAYVWSIFRLNWDDYLSMLESQNYACALCQRPFGDGIRECVDHDHACCPAGKSCGKCVRGILCDDCNKGLGHFRDDPELLRKSADYLERQPQI